MRKHNHRFAQRFTRNPGDRTNLAQRLAHNMANDKLFQFFANGLLMGLMTRI